MTIEQGFATVATALTMVTAKGHVFNHGETLGHEGQSVAQSLRIRRVPGGTQVGGDRDTILLVHPDVPLLHTAYAGPLDMPVAPGQIIQKHGQDGLFKRLMRGMRAS